MKKIFTLFLLSMMYLSTYAQSKTWYVVQGATGTGQSTDEDIPTRWADAKGDLQEVLDLAVSGDRILLASGTYVPSVAQPIGATDTRFKSFMLKDGVDIIGGHNPATGATTTTKSILSGDLGGTPSIVTDNAYNVVLAISLTTGVRLENVTISGGYSASNGTRAISNFTDVTLQNGAGIFVKDSNLTLNNVVVSNNRANGDAGGIYVLGTSNTPSTLSLTNVNFNGNISVSSGGAIAFVSYANATVNDCLFDTNSALNGGAIFSNPNLATGLEVNTLNIYKSKFISNSSTGYGGALHFYARTKFLFEDCDFTNNSNTSTANGGGVINTHNGLITGTIKKSRFISNSSSNFAAVWFSRLNNSNINDLTWENCLFYNNTAPKGTIFTIAKDAVKVYNCTFYANSATDNGTNASKTIIYNSSNSTTDNKTVIYNSIFVDNTPKNFNVANATFGKIEIGYSAFNGDGIGAATDKGNNIATGFTAAKLFANYTYNSTDLSQNTNFLHLKDHYNNPLIDAGDDTKAPQGTDLAGQLRLVKTTNHLTNNSSHKIDLGAYEFQNSVLPVELKSYVGKISGNASVLSWTTVSESDNKAFILSRSANGKVFNHLANIGAKSAQGAIYTYTDFSPLAGNNYYKLQQVDVDGEISELGVVVLKHSVAGVQLKAFPNPVKGDVLNVNFTEGVYHHLQLVNAVGTVVSSVAISTTDSAKQINVQHLPAGSYILKFSGKSKSSSVKLIK